MVNNSTIGQLLYLREKLVLVHIKLKQHSIQSLQAVSFMFVVVFMFQNQLVIFISFLVFETCVGIFWPSMSTMRGKYVPEESKYW